MRKVVITIAAGVLWCSGGCFGVFAQQQETKRVALYFLRDDTTREWCGYRSKDEWLRRVREAVATMMGYVEKAGKIRKINVRQQDTTGDWVLDDSYGLDSAGRISELMRTIIYLSDDERKETLYRIRDGHATIVRNAAFSLKTKAPLRLPLPMDQYESWPIFTRFADLPFKDLLKESAPIPKNGAYCTAGPMW